MFKLEMTDKDIEFVDDFSSDIVVDKQLTMLDSAIVGDIVVIHYDEDEENLSHEYVVKEITDDKVYLTWTGKKETDLLTEANPFKAIKDKLAPDQATKLDRAHKSAEKTAKKVDKKAADIFARDIKEGQNWNYFIQLPNGVHTKKPLTYNDVKDMYKSNRLGPWIANAVVTANGNFIVRRGKEDLDETGTQYTKSNSKLQPGYTQQWTQADVEAFKELRKNSKVIDKAVKETLAKAPVKNKKSSDEGDGSNKSKTTTNTETEQPKTQSGPITDKIIAKFSDLVKAAGITVIDNSGDKVANIKSITPNTASDYWIMVNNKEFELDKWLESAVKSKILTENCDVSSVRVDEVLVESPVIKLDDADIMNPAQIDFTEKRKQAIDDEQNAKILKQKEQKTVELKSKYAPVKTKMDTMVRNNNLPDSILDMLFENLVPDSGEAETVAGELVRAIVRILYRDYNDGDKFFEGYGITTCASSAEYLFDNGFAEEIQNILDRAYLLSEDDENYTAAIEHVANNVVQHIVDNPELLFTENEEDSREYSIEYIEENQPRYEFEVYGSDDVVTLVDSGVIDAWKLNEYVEHILEFNHVYDDAEVSRPWSHDSTTVTIENLTRDGYDYINDSFTRNPDEFWEDLVSEYSDYLNDETYDDDYDIEDNEASDD